MEALERWLNSKVEELRRPPERGIRDFGPNGLSACWLDFISRFQVAGIKIKTRPSLKVLRSQREGGSESTLCEVPGSCGWKDREAGADLGEDWHCQGELGSQRKKTAFGEKLCKLSKHKTLEAACSQTQDSRSSRFTKIRHSKQQARVSWQANPSSMRSESFE